MVSVLQRPPQRGRNRAGPSPYFHDPAIGIVSHDHTARVARQPLGRFRGNVCAALEDRLAGRVGVGQHGRIDVDDHLIALAGSAGIDQLKQAIHDEIQRAVTHAFSRSFLVAALLALLAAVPLALQPRRT